MHKGAHSVLAKQTNILSFDEVRQGVRTRPNSEHASSARSSYRQENRSQRPASLVSTTSRERVGAFSGLTPAASRPTATSRRFASDAFPDTTAASSFGSRAVRAEASVADRYGFPSDRGAKAGRGTSAGRGIGDARRARSGTETRRADEGCDDDPVQNDSIRRKESRLASLKRSRAKEQSRPRIFEAVRRYGVIGFPRGTAGCGIQGRNGREAPAGSSHAGQNLDARGEARFEGGLQPVIRFCT